MADVKKDGLNRGFMVSFKRETKMTEDQLALIAFGIISLLCSVFILTLKPKIIKKNWHSRSEKIEIFLLRSSKISGICFLLLSVFWFVLIFFI